MSEKTERLQAVYRQIFQSEAGEHLIAWIKESSTRRRADAGKSEPIPAWGELRFADGMDEVVSHITTMCGLEQIGKKR